MVEQLSQVNKKLNVLLNLLLEKRQKEHKNSDEDQVGYLASFDFSPSEMALILGKSSNAIRIAQTKLRKKGKLSK